MLIYQKLRVVRDRSPAAPLITSRARKDLVTAILTCTPSGMSRPIFHTAVVSCLFSGLRWAILPRVVAERQVLQLK
jgi:hypothetical protein